MPIFRESVAGESTRLAWLSATLCEQRERVILLLRRMTGIGSPGAMKAPLFRKFLMILDQVAVAREREVRILHQIDEIEAQHRRNRENHQLEHAEPHKDGAHGLGADAARAPHPNRGYLWFLAFWQLFARDRINQNKQGLTGD